MKIVLHHTASPKMLSLLEEMATAEGHLVAAVDVDDAAGLRREMPDADVLFHVLAPVGEADFAAAPRLRMVQKIGVGVDTIDLLAANRHGIKVANMPGTNSQAVAEMGLLLILAALRRIVWLDRRVRAGEGWSLPPASFDGMGEVCGSTVGLVGLGQVARRLRAALEALGAKVIHHTLSPGQDENWRTLDALFAEADVVSLHLPLTPSTAGMIDAKAIGRMKPGVVLVNTARGGLVDEPALLDALRSGRVACAGLDTLAQEPPRSDHPFFSLDNVVLTPHVAWLTPQTLARSLTVAFENCRRLVAGETLLHQVQASPL